jgi:hypothetical protein
LKDLNLGQEVVLKQGLALSQKIETDNLAKLLTLMLVQKALEEETAIATTTHEAVQQLLAAAEILPRNVAAADWFRYGISSFFETPRLALYDSTAAPSWTNLIYFKHHRDRTGKFDKDQSALVLYNVITDKYFSQLHMALNVAENAEDKAVARKLAADRQELAHGSAWALTYYLMNFHLDKVLAYSDELKQLPRDTEYSPEVLAGCFGRAFGLKQAPPGSLIPLEYKDLLDLSQAWYGKTQDQVFLLDVASVEVLSLQEMAAPPMKKKKKKTGPNTGM